MKEAEILKQAAEPKRRRKEHNLVIYDGTLVVSGTGTNYGYISTAPNYTITTDEAALPAGKDA
jgi:hypothetical protein